jgi:hypothetical protein
MGGTIHQDIYPAELGKGALDHCLDRLVVGNVHFQGATGPSFRLDLETDRFHSLLVDPRCHHEGSVAGELDGNAAADPTTPPGDDRDAAR